MEAKVNVIELHKTHLEDDVKIYLEKSLCNEKAEEVFGKAKCKEKFCDILGTLSRPPYFTTLRINTLESGLDVIQKKVKETLDQLYKDKGWPPPELCPHSVLQDTVVIPTQGPHDVEPVETEVIVDVRCGMAVLRGADIFAQGILSAPPTLDVGHQVSVYIDLDRACRKGLTKTYTGSKLFIGNGVARISRQQLFCGNSTISGIGIQMTRPIHAAPPLSDFLPDLIFPQNLPSVVCGHVVDPEPGQSVLDMCAAPGGKTTHLAILMKNKGRVVAFDKSKNKIPKILSNCEKLGVTCVEAYCCDGTKSVDADADACGPPPYPPASFDKVLLDAPCSALGQRPAIRNWAKLPEITAYVPLQRKLFTKAVQLLKPGGALVYSTCTLPVEENENLVAWALREHPELALSKQKFHIGGPGWPCPGLTEQQCHLVQRFGPSSSLYTENSADSDTIGFFIAKFLKQESMDR